MPVLMVGGAGGGSGSDECTATRAKVLTGYTAVTKDSDDEVVNGTLSFIGTAVESDVYPSKTFYNTDPNSRKSGTLAPNAITSFAATNYSTGTILLTWKRPSSRWSGIRIGYKEGAYPSSVNDSSATWIETADVQRSISVTIGKTYKFRAWNYLQTSVGRIYGSYSDVSMYAPNNAGSTTLYGSGTWQVPTGVRSVTVFMVGGGGGGGKNSSGGGGGGYTKTVTISVTPNSNIAYSVGTGGSAGTSGSDGKDTTFGGQTAKGGKGGGSKGGDGGSGGGAGAIGTNQGKKGGSNGGDGDSNVGHDGGYGQHSSTRAWGSTSTSETLYSGGGGGGGKSNYGGGAGGDGGGGSSGWDTFSAKSGLANTGGGGGSSYTGAAGSGGSGIILVKWS